METIVTLKREWQMGKKPEKWGVRSIAYTLMIQLDYFESGSAVSVHSRVTLNDSAQNAKIILVQLQLASICRLTERLT